MGNDETTERGAPPDSPRVGRRALILAALTCRGYIDTERNVARARWTHRRLLEWLERITLGDEIRPSEAAVLRAPVGSLTDAKRTAATRSADALVVVAWAQKGFNLLRHDRAVDPYEITDSVGLLNHGYVHQLVKRDLRPFEEIEALDGVMGATHARLRALENERSFVDISSSFDPAKLSMLGIDAPIADDGDVAIDARPALLASDERRRACQALVEERHRATRWLVGALRTYADG
jgi:hypothetical protein